ncbi:MAG: beta-lactamase family protein [Alteromonadales bacterium]|nr:beta-lactamase family protein [Alteromonadales bacterium]
MLEDERSTRTINNLCSKTAFDDKYQPPQSLQKQLALHKTPGISIAVIDDYKIDWARGFGYCEEGKARKVVPRTLFQAGSISKPIFALAVMRLVEEGRISLDQDVNKYLTSWRVPANSKWQPRITLRQLLSHTGGVTVHGFSGYSSSELIPTISDILNGEASTNSERIEVNILPGLQCRYSGGGTTIAQQVIVDLLGKSFPTIMRELVLEPLGMNDSSFEQPPSAWTERGATAHPWNGKPLEDKYHIYPEMAAAGLWTTATDLAIAGVELFKILNGDTSGILSRETVESMLCPQLMGQNIDEGSEYSGLGFFCSGKGDHFQFKHTGWDEGFVAEFRMYRNLGKGVVIMLNSNQGYPLMEEVVRSIGLEYDWPESTPSKNSILILDPSIEYTGKFETESGVFFSITGQDNSLMLKLVDQEALPITPISILEFQSEVTNTNISFQTNENKIVKSIIVSQAGQQFKAVKTS